MCDIIKVMLTGKFMALHTYIRKEESSSNNIPSFQRNKLEKEQNTP